MVVIMYFVIVVSYTHIHTLSLGRLIKKCRNLKDTSVSSTFVSGIAIPFLLLSFFLYRFTSTMATTTTTSSQPSPAVDTITTTEANASNDGDSYDRLCMELDELTLSYVFKMNQYTQDRTAASSVLQKVTTISTLLLKANPPFLFLL